MRRAVLTLSGTAAGLVALFSFKSHVPAATPVAAPSTPAGLSVSAPPSPTASSPSASPSKTAKKAAPKTAPATAPATTEPTLAPPTSAPMTTEPTTEPTTTPAPAPSTSSPAGPSGTFTGPDESADPYGDVQVQITVVNGKITAASDLQPTDDEIGSNAVSEMNQEVVTDQSGNINAVSGATSTSSAYIGSLQQAIDQAGL